MDATAAEPIDSAGARALAQRCFSSPGSAQRVGLELEWHVFDADDLSRRPTPDEVRAAAGGDTPLARGVTTSVEPGGQIELDTPPLPLRAAVALAEAASAELHRRLAGAHLVAAATGSDPHRAPLNVLDLPRYNAMAQAFSARGPHGVRMMANTAAVQINIDLTPDHGRWQLAHQLGPVLVAAFANSPVGPDGAVGLKSHRLANWFAIDPTRTAPVDCDGDPVQAWFGYAMAANVLLIRRNGEALPIVEPFTFEQWMADGHGLGRPTTSDFAYHLTTLFPPVRPRGYLELRFLDALERPSWLVAAALIAGLGHERCLGEALTLTRPAHDLWMRAAAVGFDDPVLASVADAVTPLALEGLEHLDAGPEIMQAVCDWRDHDLAARRCPADDLLDRWTSTGSIIKLPETAPR